MNCTVAPSRIHAFVTVASLACLAACAPPMTTPDPTVPSAFAAGSGWTTVGHLPGDGSTGVDGVANLRLIDLAASNGGVHAIWEQSLQSQQDPLIQTFDAPLQGGPSALTPVDFGVVVSNETIILAQGYASGTAAIATRGEDPLTGTGTEVVHSFTNAAGIAATASVLDYFMGYHHYIPSFQEDGLFVIRNFVYGGGQETPGVTLLLAEGTALSTVAGPGAVRSTGGAGSVVHARVDGVSYVAWSDEGVTVYGEPDGLDGQLVVGRVDGAALTELARIDVTAAVLAQLRTRFSLVVDGDRYFVLGITPDPGALTVQELAAGAAATTIPLDNHVGYSEIALAVHGPRAVVGIADTRYEGKATVLELVDGALTPLGPEGFSSDPGRIELRFVGDTLYVAVHNLAAATIEVASRE